MNILFLTKEYYHEELPSSGGTGRFISNLSKSLVNEGHNVYVFGLEKKSIFIDDFGVKVTYKKNKLLRNHIYKLCKSISKKVSFLRKYHDEILKSELKLIVKELDEFILKNNLQIDIIETHDFDGISLFLDKKIPYVIRCHGCFSLFYNYFNIDVKKHIMDWEREAFNKAENIITISKYSESLYKELFNINKSKLIYNGIDTEKFKKIEGDLIPKSIFYLGNTSIEKGADIAIEVFIELLKIEPNSTLHFIGRETSYKSEILQILTDNNITDKVFFYGFQTVEEIVKLISKAETVIFPSKGETFGLALCETMAIEKPVVVSNIGSFNEIIENNYNGIIANTIQDYIDSILFLFENEHEAKKIGVNARKTILEKFNETNLMNETLNYYQEVVNNHKITNIKQ